MKKKGGGRGCIVFLMTLVVLSSTLCASEMVPALCVYNLYNTDQDMA